MEETLEPPFAQVLDPAFSVVAARELIDRAVPLLRAAVNHATHAFVRCQSGTRGHAEHEDLAPFVLYRHVIETSDAITVLLEQSCATPALPLLRSSFEGSLGLEYALKADTLQRSRAFLTGFVHSKLTTNRFADLSTQEGQDFSALYLAQLGSPSPGSPNAPAAIAHLESVLLRPYMQSVEAEYQRVLKTGRKGPPAWYSLFGGPSSIKKLADELGRKVEYTLLYHVWSRFSHAVDIGASVAPTGAHFKALRNPEDMKLVTLLATDLQLRATSFMIDKYRHGEPMQAWYNREIVPRRERLNNTVVKIETSSAPAP